MAFTSPGAREAARARKLATSHPDVFYARLQSDAVLSAAYDKYKQDVKDLKLPGVRPKDFTTWVAGQHGHDLVKPAASAVKDLDEVMTPHATKRWNR